VNTSALARSLQRFCAIDTRKASGKQTLDSKPSPDQTIWHNRGDRRRSTLLDFVRIRLRIGCRTHRWRRHGDPPFRVRPFTSELTGQHSEGSAGSRWCL